MRMRRRLARQALTIERHYKRPMDISGARAGVDGKLYMSQQGPKPSVPLPDGHFSALSLEGKIGKLVSGRAIGQKIGSGPVRLVPDATEMSRVQEGDVLVADMTDPIGSR